MRILTLMHEDLVPPDDGKGFSEKEMAQWQTEYDVVKGLRSRGHVVEKLGVTSDLGKIRERILEFKPHIAFNLLEEFHGEAIYDQHVASYLELMRQPFTGCNPRGLTLSRDKALSKKIFLYHRIPTPRFAIFPLGRKVAKLKKLNYPLIVKSVVEDASMGISQASLVSSDEKLQERVAFIHESIRTDAIAEQYIDGRELYLGILGNQKLKPLTIWELWFKNLPESALPIATTKVKFDENYQKKIGLQTGKARHLSPELEKYILRISKRAYRVLGLTGYARFDFRLTKDNQVYLIEANANPGLTHDEEFAMSAKSAGYDYEGLLEKIMSLGLQYGKRWE